jgi:hypothetical protein
MPKGQQSQGSSNKPKLTSKEKKEKKQKKKAGKATP